MSQPRGTAFSSVQPLFRVAYMKITLRVGGLSSSVNKFCELPAKKLQEVTFLQRREVLLRRSEYPWFALRPVLVWEPGLSFSKPSGPHGKRERLDAPPPTHLVTVPCIKISARCLL